MASLNCLDCGKPLYPRPDRETTGYCRNCGPSHFNTKRPYESLYNTFLKYQRERNIPVELSFEEFLTFTHIHDCHYCGKTVTWTKFNSVKNGAAYNLDRKDNSQGYSVDNCVVCCIRCNKMKSDDISYEVFVEIGAVLKKWKH